MDLAAFTDFVLAWDHRSHPAAIKYFFPIMDLQNKVRDVPVSTLPLCASVLVMLSHSTIKGFAPLAY